jgi:uncharacterized protein YegJ (DUF2314 family)
MRIPLLVILAILTKGCGYKDPMKVAFHPVDPQLEDATKAARSVLTNFITELSAPRSNQAYFALCARFDPPGSGEFLWITNPCLQHGMFSGTLSQTPQHAKGISPGETVHISESQVADWMYVQDGKLVGGYTLRLWRNRMTQQEKAVYESRVPYKFE